LGEPIWASLRLFAVVTSWRGLAYRLARLYADYNHIHPFREGNGRAGALLLHTVAALCGRRLDLTGVSREEWYAASRDGMPFRRDGRANHRPFLPLFAAALATPKWLAHRADRRLASRTCRGES
jgi:fido (protein-threonine AMPylation protein)